MGDPVSDPGDMLEKWPSKDRNTERGLASLRKQLSVLEGKTGEMGCGFSGPCPSFLQWTFMSVQKQNKTGLDNM